MGYTVYRIHTEGGEEQRDLLWLAHLSENQPASRRNRLDIPLLGFGFDSPPPLLLLLFAVTLSPSFFLFQA